MTSGRREPISGQCRNWPAVIFNSSISFWQPTCIGALLDFVPLGAATVAPLRDCAGRVVASDLQGSKWGMEEC